ncbi:relaxase/mobilization nuclease domain-containing protein [Dinoroseobacter sp. S76]|uniref:relaxase/mobilization nuclease domain-containing protein n=1 Tax=Dinoroseobacter sp. S76 TaxID=3415124 RepID=UPI003C7D52D1
MTPKVSRGTSFKGVGQYLLHDKAATTSDRVAFIDTMNLPTANANAAIAHMIDTATHADDIKRAAGVSLAGQKQQRPVYHYSLAWHPSETVTMDVQMEAARESLKALGFDDRQALIVGHNDTEHPHVHVVVNLVSTENGKFPSLSNDRVKLSEWALDYERRRGVVFCKDRETNQAAREQGQWVKDDSPSRSAWMAWKKAETKQLWEEYRKDRDAAREGRKGQYDALYQQRQNRLETRRQEVKQLFKPTWREVFQRQRDQLKEYDTSLKARISHARRVKGSTVVNMFKALVKDQALRGELVKFHKSELKDIGNQQNAVIADAAREVVKAWKYDRDQLKDMHRQQDQTRLDATKEKSQSIWSRDGKTQDRQASDRDQKAQSPRKSLEDVIKGDPKDKKARQERKRKRRERDKSRGRGQGRTLDM